jgi:hypothetical protein
MHTLKEINLTTRKAKTKETRKKNNSRHNEINKNTSCKLYRLGETAIYWSQRTLPTISWFSESESGAVLFFALSF